MIHREHFNRDGRAPYPLSRLSRLNLEGALSCSGLAVSVSSGCWARVVMEDPAKTSNLQSRTNLLGMFTHTSLKLIVRTWVRGTSAKLEQ